VPFGDHDAPSTLLGGVVLGYRDQLVEVEAVAASAYELLSTTYAGARADGGMRVRSTGDGAGRYGNEPDLPYGKLSVVRSPPDRSSTTWHFARPSCSVEA
jgi:hypothetical protein